MREPGNHDNGASDVWALTAYSDERVKVNKLWLKFGEMEGYAFSEF